ncbi:MAG: MMPL family transporter, partial [Eggerthellales bacterium]|nr:MMPL family transporter [Eggerthellales bacterium]
MTKLANFIVDHAKAVLVAILALTVASALGMLLIQVNYDQTKYLPEDSDTRVGLAVMDTQFCESTPVNVMVSGLGADQGQQVADALGQVAGVASVSYQEDSTASDWADYHQNGNTLFVLELSGGTYSGEADLALSNVYDYCAELEASGNETYVGGPIVDYKSMFSSLPKVIAIALALLLVILLIMSTSWVEPFLFLVNIGVAVVLNMGTNFIFGPVSQTTFSIGAVLQLVLSMDYSIMLMDRYRQLRPSAPDAASAMKESLAGGFSAITASSFTTLAGMLCLIAMSFTIGADMGRVLAKGVLMSLVTVFTVLPAMTVLLDGAILATPKKAPHFSGAPLAKASYVLRPVILCAMAALVVVGFAVKDKAGINFFTASYNPDQAVIQENFGSTEQVVILYGNKDEAAVAGVMQGYEGADGVKSVNGYYNTLGARYDASGLAEKMDMTVSMMRVMYYYYFMGTDVSPMTVNQLAAFIRDDIAQNPDFKNLVDEDMLDQVDTLYNLSDPETITSPRTPESMAQLFGSDPEQVSLLYLFYFMVNGGVDEGSMTVPQFIQFLLDQSGSSLMGSAMDSASVAQLQALTPYLDASANSQQLTSDQLAARMGMGSDQALGVYQYRYLTSGNINGMTMALPQVLQAVLALSQDPAYGGSFDQAQIQQLSQMESLCSLAASGVSLSAAQLAACFGMDETQVTQLFYLYASLHGTMPPEAMTLVEFVAFLCDDVAGNDAVLAMM